jgi:hypothetical protein
VVTALESAHPHAFDRAIDLAERLSSYGLKAVETASESSCKVVLATCSSS